MAERTVLDFYRRELDSPRGEHYSHWTPDGRRTLSTEQFFDRTSALAVALGELGVGRGDRVMLLSDNRPEWHMVDLAVAANGAVDVPIYATLTADQIAAQLDDSGAVVAVAEGPEQMAAFLSIRERCPSLEHLIQIDGPTDHGVSPLDELVGSASGVDAEAAFWDRAAAVEPNGLLTIIYTSGTTGEPKGVMLTHDNLVQNVVFTARRAPIQREDLLLEFLPLCHVTERMAGYIGMLKELSKAYCSVAHVADLIADIRPTLFAGVPRFYEKVMQRITDRVASAPSARRALFRWALGIGREAARRRISGEAPGRLLATQHRIADRLVLSRVRDAFGGRVRYCLCGGAELPLFVNEFFHALGFFLIEGYGLTETAGVVSANGSSPGEIRLGTVGRPLDNVEIRLADDGELLVRGPIVMAGYWNRPEATAEVVDDDGFLATGDIAELDDQGFVVIVDRKKDLIVTAGGKNVAPQPIENRIKQSALVETVVVVGDGRPYITALVVPSFDDLERRARRAGLTWVDHAELVADPVVNRFYDEVISEANQSLARFEQVRRFLILSRPLSIEDGQLTPTLKVKRRVVEEQLAGLIDRLYRD